MDSGCNLYLTKPFNLEVLQLNVKNLLRERNMKQEQNRKKIEINTSEVEVVSMDDQLIQKAVALVELHIEDPMLSVEFLSKELGMSRVHLYKKTAITYWKKPHRIHSLHQTPTRSPIVGQKSIVGIRSCL
ncbi:hypothetical protein [Algoriphagus boritolerans]|uniref:hypothetical protein n=1 Tax=Algoriphagus boritolerans TaxID=308111 RepID=UPI000A9AF793